MDRDVSNSMGPMSLEELTQYVEDQFSHGASMNAILYADLEKRVKALEAPAPSGLLKDVEIGVLRQALYNMTREYLRASEGKDSDPERATRFMEHIIKEVCEQQGVDYNWLAEPK